MVRRRQQQHRSDGGEGAGGPEPPIPQTPFPVLTPVSCGPAQALPAAAASASHFHSASVTDFSNLTPQLLLCV